MGSRFNRIEALAAVLLGSLCMSWLCRSAHAAAASSELGGRGPRLVVLESRFIGTDDAALRQALSELLGRIQLRIAPAGSVLSEPVLARVTIAPTLDGAVVIVQPVEPPGAIERHEVLDAASPELFRETLAHVVLGAVEPLLESRAMPEPPPEDPSADQGAPPEPGSRSALQLSGWLGGRASALWFLAEGTGAALVGAAAGVTLDARWQPGLGLEAGYLIPLSVDHEGLTAAFSLVALRARPSVQVFSSPGVSVRAELAPGVNFISLEPEQAAAEILSTEKSSRVQPMLGVAGAAYFRLSRELSAVARFGLDFDFAPRRWLIAGVEREVFFETTRLEPQTTLGFDWSPRATTAEASP